MANTDKEALQSQPGEDVNKDAVASEPPKQGGVPHGPDIVLRSFQPADLPYTKHLYYTTYFNLVPGAVKHKMLSPLTWSLYMGACKLTVSTNIHV